MFDSDEILFFQMNGLILGTRPDSPMNRRASTD